MSSERDEGPEKDEGRTGIPVEQVVVGPEETGGSGSTSEERKDATLADEKGVGESNGGEATESDKKNLSASVETTQERGTEVIEQGSKEEKVNAEELETSDQTKRNQREDGREISTKSDEKSDVQEEIKQTDENINERDKSETGGRPNNKSLFDSSDSEAENEKREKGNEKIAGGGEEEDKNKEKDKTEVEERKKETAHGNLW